jgi:hypothetical protein
LKPLSGDILGFEYGIERMKGTMMRGYLGKDMRNVDAIAISIKKALTIDHDELRLRQYSHLIPEKTSRRGQTDRERANISLDLALAKSSFVLPHSICTNLHTSTPNSYKQCASFLVSISSLLVTRQLLITHPLCLHPTSCPPATD